MTIINGRACVVNGTPVDKVFSNGRQVYGRNLVLNSADLSNFSTWTANHSKPTVSADGYEMTIVTKHGGLNIGYLNLSKYLPNIGDTVTISVEAKGNATLQFNYNNGSGFTPGKAMPITADYKRYSAQFVWNPVAGINQQFVIYTVDSTDTTLVIKHPQIEISSVATPWSPAPEDVLKGDITTPKNLVESQSYIK